MIATYGERAVFIDGRIKTNLIAVAAEDGNIKRFFNRLFHDKGVDWQRLVYFQTVSTRRWGEKRKRGIANLHFHALVILPERQSNKQIRATLETVFGKAGNMGGTFNDLNLNEGKRSRKVPIERLRCNRRAKGLARGIPSNFNFKAALCDHVSMDAGRRVFLAWLKEERELERQRKIIVARERVAIGAKKDRATDFDSPAHLVNR
ncbi:hypothetical protein ACQQ2Q_22355 [Agrobacterium sp. ES01]|uniref:hypothetical protein n=1 Tax=Agrobacterium sp. ES01 TaxID=3420714 RepID=UPI003D0A9F8B